MCSSDLAFQKKCLGKMDGVAKSGRTVLFVSHNMGAIHNLCARAIWLNNGQIMKEGATIDVIKEYEWSQILPNEEFSSVIQRGQENARKLSFYFSCVEMLNTKGEHTAIFRYNEKLILIVHLEGKPIGDYSVEFRIYNESGQLVSMGASGAYHDMYFDKTIKKIRIAIGPLIHPSQRYTISLSVIAGGRRTDTWDACSFLIDECRPFGPSHDIHEAASIVQHSFHELK